MISEIVAISALFISLASLIFSWTVYRNTKNKENQNEIFTLKLSKYQEILTICRLLIHHENTIPESNKDLTISEQMSKLFKLTDECTILAPAEIAMSTLKLAFSFEKLNEARKTKSKEEKNIFEETSEGLAKFLGDSRDDLGLDQLNNSLLKRITN